MMHDGEGTTHSRWDVLGGALLAAFAGFCAYVWLTDPAWAKRPIPDGIMVAFLVLFFGGLLLLPVLSAWAEAWQRSRQCPAGAWDDIDPLPLEDDWFLCSGFFALFGGGALGARFDLPAWAWFLLVFAVWFVGLFALGGISAFGIRVIRATAGGRHRP